MNELDLYNSIVSAITSDEEIKESAVAHCLIQAMKMILAEDNPRLFYKMTKATILFEGFYKALSKDSAIRKAFLQLRSNRWKNHYGTPTLLFLLSYQQKIDAICNQFKLSGSSQIDIQELDIDSNIETDNVNQIIVDNTTIKNVALPAGKESEGKLIKTNNPIGGFTTIPCDPYSKKFLSYVADVATRDGKVLEVGAAFGAASLQALSLGATVYCNDIDPNNLAVVCNRYHDGHGYNRDASTGDSNKLVFVPGSFPDELSGLPKNSFDAILICRVLHFFKGEIIEKSIRQMGELLKPGGKLFIVCETPYLKNWQRFIPEYEKRVAQGVEWPGEITNQSEYENSGYAATLPTLMNFMSKVVIDRTINRSGLFDIEQSSYINRAGQFPEDLLLDGRESVGAVAVKK
ncbi:MAG: hypothetical protein A3E82_05805 [Gammaproteobacteria bacterium RIFCSPHIGHO2_12_FULL_38_11]|nr:MAG: hypothetical protein A3E82_05805 [Gammaproteobacteria bacterium RIFCSPHIGHO2_12_FULL_38_11]